MWEIITSQGHRARDIQHESDALRRAFARSNDVDCPVPILG
jgi:hypothetical protein